MTEFDRLMREADLDRARGEVVKAAKAFAVAYEACEENESVSDAFMLGQAETRAEEALLTAVNELLKLEEKR